MINSDRPRNSRARHIARARARWAWGLSANSQDDFTQPRSKGDIGMLKTFRLGH
jgi:hypothetical protein